MLFVFLFLIYDKNARALFTWGSWPACFYHSFWDVMHTGSIWDTYIGNYRLLFHFNTFLDIRNISCSCQLWKINYLLYLHVWYSWIQGIPQINHHSLKCNIPRDCRSLGRASSRHFAGNRREAQDRHCFWDNSSNIQPILKSPGAKA